MTGVMHQHTAHTPVGPLKLVADEHGLMAALWSSGWPRLEHAPYLGAREELTPFLQLVVEQLHAYLHGEIERFRVPLTPVGTPFQQTVWQALQRVPYGETTTYGDLAMRLDKPTAVRAVANANARNPLSIFVPCHRVIGRDGTLTGYAGGLPAKAWLLDHERHHAAGPHGEQLGLFAR